MVIFTPRRINRSKVLRFEEFVFSAISLQVTRKYPITNMIYNGKATPEITEKTNAKTGRLENFSECNELCNIIATLFLSRNLQENGGRLENFSECNELCNIIATLLLSRNLQENTHIATRFVLRIVV